MLLESIERSMREMSTPPPRPSKVMQHPEVCCQIRERGMKRASEAGGASIQCQIGRQFVRQRRGSRGATDAEENRKAS